ncbi:NAD-binding protein [Aquimarina hainanensis]|uniref:NAD-binding protein n=1 Tax=Aquimarina hainanensis TaxID=1578017 RepID=A0ABW5NDI6_9FLAO|nr:NAD-binding protein [Aquimarina sp. TRL1]QKX06436.1 hypothetical protein HN014_16455 [Aquimarina sp. TRL1]
MKTLFQFIDSIKKEYPDSELPFLKRQLKRVQSSKPYQGIRILHNIPFTKETIVKLEVLYAGGADVTVISPSFMEVDPTLVASFIDAGGIWKDALTPNDSFDIHLDCAAELLTHKQPAIGTVEITGTGTNKYKATTTYPVISVDQSAIKMLEGVLGTGEAFIRAFKQLATEEIHNKHFMIFGYGKVGKGIAHYLKKETPHITIVENDPLKVAQAQQAGFNGLIARETTQVQAAADKMDAIVTATGVRNVISDTYDSTFFASKYLANMGGEDEFGTAFATEDVLCNKMPINFFIEKPTLMRYLDPVFYAHNSGVDLLLFANLKNGLHPFPAFIADEVVEEWKTLFKESIPS